MKVLKFGGTSVGTPESLANVKAIVEGATEPVVVVVSALGGLTDKLIATANDAAAGRPEYQEAVNAIFDRHHRVIDAVVAEERRPATLLAVNTLLQELADTYDALYAAARQGEAADVPQAVMDKVVAFGERCSSHIVTDMIAGARRFDSLELIKTRTRFDKHVLDNEATAAALAEAFGSWSGQVAVVPGFISRDTATRTITNLGRGGSDYTAAILAAALGARLLEIWTDVDGFMTADPRQISSAYVIKTLTFVEAMELCNFGAKVIYPPTIYPVFHKNIPIVIKNTFNPSAPGTLIGGDAPAASAEGVHGISSIKATVRFELVAADAEGLSQLHARMLNALARNGVTALFPTRHPRHRSVTVCVAAAEAGRTTAALAEEFEADRSAGHITALDCRDGLSTIAVVGHGLRSAGGVAERVAARLAALGVETAAHSAAGGDTSVAVVVPSARLDEAMKALHDEFFSQTVSTHAVVVNADASSPVHTLIKASADALARSAHLQLMAVAPGAEEEFMARTVLDLRGDVASYPQWLMRGVAVVTDADMPDDVYAPLEALAAERGVPFTVFGARLAPAVESAVAALMATGDEVTRLEAPTLARARQHLRRLMRRSPLDAAALEAVDTAADPTLGPAEIRVCTRRIPAPGLVMRAETTALPPSPGEALDALVDTIALQASRPQTNQLQ